MTGEKKSINSVVKEKKVVRKKKPDGSMEVAVVWIGRSMIGDGNMLATESTVDGEGPPFASMYSCTVIIRTVSVGQLAI